MTQLYRLVGLVLLVHAIQGLHAEKGKEGLENPEKQDIKRSKFVFGKRTQLDADNKGNDEELSDMISNIKRKFSFGKRMDNANENAVLSELESLNDANKRMFKFGKRTFQFGKKNFQFGKRKFQFGKRMDNNLDLNEDDTDIPDKKAQFQFGKRNFQFGKRTFQFGKREDENINDDSNKRTFQFGKRTNTEHVEFKSANGKEKRSVEYVDEVAKRPFGNGVFQFGKRYTDEISKRPFGNNAFQFGKRFHDDSEYNNLKKKSSANRSFQFGKRSYNLDEDEYIVKRPFGARSYGNYKRQYAWVPNDYDREEHQMLRNNRKFLLGKRIGNSYADAMERLAEERKRAFGSNAHNWQPNTHEFIRFNDDEPEAEASRDRLASEKRAFGGGVNTLFG